MNINALKLLYFDRRLMVIISFKRLQSRKTQEYQYQIIVSAHSLKQMEKRFYLTRLLNLIRHEQKKPLHKLQDIVCKQVMT